MGFVIPAIVIIFIFFLTISRVICRPTNFPPGPAGFFSFTCLWKRNQPFIFKEMVKLSDEHGPIVGLFLANKSFCCVSGYKAVREVLNNTVINGRPNAFDFALRTKGLNKGILMTEGELWQEQRRFAVRHLKDLGFGKSSLEGLMIEEIAELIADVQTSVQESSNGNIFLENTFTAASMNVMWAVVAGSRLHRTDPQRNRLVNAVSGFLRSSTGAGILNAMPFLRFLAPEMTGYKDLVKNVERIRSFLQDIINERLQKPNEDVHDFIDVYLAKIQAEKDVPDSNFELEQLLAVLIDLFVAGTETTGNLLGFSLVYMIHHPDVQARVQREIDDILLGQPPSLSDIGRMPYTEATLMEIQRLGVVAPITVPHIATEDTTVMGYDVPKGTFFFINLWSVFTDATVWDEPLRFWPERHLDSCERVIRSDHLMTFGLGKRICLGQSLAKSTSFLFFSSVMQRFRFSMPANGITDFDLMPSLEPIPGLTLGPRPCIAHVMERHPFAKTA